MCPPDLKDSLHAVAAVKGRNYLWGQHPQTGQAAASADKHEKKKNQVKIKTALTTALTSSRL